jgi:hypothetical protein
MKHASRLLSLLVLTAAFVVLTGSACKKSAPDRVWERGAFEPVAANQQTYSLPAGITIDSCYGYDDYIPESNLPLYMVVGNSKTTDVTVTFPAGLVFDASNAEYQYMMLLKDFTFTAKVGVTDSVLVPTYCCNEELTEPDDESFYTIAGIEWDKETEELFDLVAPKALNTEEALDVAVDALFEITDGDSGLTDTTRTKLQALP